MFVRFFILLSNKHWALILGFLIFPRDFLFVFVKKERVKNFVLVTRATTTLPNTKYAEKIKVKLKL